ncbi:hypothetical protein BC941DRAFT_434950 [Chlamydoabsidia padenii]|nr:hypothetical protein BC941DRAFT_434950 [Chlamydoabsidia padenii]
MGGFNSDPAEQHKTHQLLKQWLLQIYTNPATLTLTHQNLLRQIIALREKRRYERYLRWQDSPHHIMMGSQGLCFIPSQWMVHWELFVEGWRAIPPDIPIDHDHWRSMAATQDQVPLSINFSPSPSQSSDLVVVSHQTWSYLVSNYPMVGCPITEDDLRQRKVYKDWLQRLELWKSRLLV